MGCDITVQSDEDEDEGGRWVLTILRGRINTGPRTLFSQRYVGLDAKVLCMELRVLLQAGVLQVYASKGCSLCTVLPLVYLLDGN